MKAVVRSLPRQFTQDQSPVGEDRDACKALGSRLQSRTLGLIDWERPKSLPRQIRNTTGAATMFCFFPWSTDAPIYHWPIATVSLIVTNALVFASYSLDHDFEAALAWSLWIGQGLHVRLKLAQVLLATGTRPRQALRVLSKLPVEPLTPKLEVIRQELLAQAKRLEADGVMELAVEDW